MVERDEYGCQIDKGWTVMVIFMSQLTRLGTQSFSQTPVKMLS